MPFSVPVNYNKVYDLKVKLTEPNRHFKDGSDFFISFKGVVTEQKRNQIALDETVDSKVPQEHVFYNWRYNTETKIVETSRGTKYLFEEPST